MTRTRNRRTAKDAGTRFETACSTFIADETGLKVERRRLAGALDKGDIAGFRTANDCEVVVECKDYGGNYKLSEWWAEAERERGNAGADVAVVVFKRKGVGLARTGEQFVITTLHDFLEMVR